MPMRHRLLVRQVRQALGVTSERELRERMASLRARGDAELADGLEQLFQAAEQSYQQFERDLQVRTRMLEISSAELTEANTQLRSEAERQSEILQSLQTSVHRLTHGLEGGLDQPAAPGDFDTDLLRLTHVLEALVQQREQARDALALAEAANRRMLNSLREVVFQTDLAGNWVYLNPAWQTITGFTVAESLGKAALGYIHPDDRQANLPRLYSLLARDEHYFRQNMRYSTKAGGYRWLEVFASRVDDDKGRVLGLSGSLIDITEQKMAQDSLILSEERLGQALKAADSRLWDWDMAQAQPYVDPAWLINLGYSADDPNLTAIEWHKQMHPDDAQVWREHLREHLRQQRPELDLELRFATASGDWRYTALRGKVIAWGGKRALRIAGTLQDISARKAAEEEVLRQQELTEQILDQLPIPVFLKDRSGTFVRFNRQFQLFSQRRRDEMLNKVIDDFASKGWSDITRAEDEQAWASGSMVTTERRLTNVDPPVDLLVNRIVIKSGGESYLLGFSIDISEQRAARDAMQRAVESAEAASRAKSEFLANMSHEIRTPMNGILGMTELVLESRLSDTQREDIALVKGSADALLTIINDILDFSKIEAGKLDIEDIPFDLRKLVQETLKSMSLRAQQKSISLECQWGPDLPRTVKGDPGRLRQVLINLLGNAIKFTQAGAVTVSVNLVREVDERCEIKFAVRDTGIGIPPEKQKLIFEAFSQVDGSTTRQYGGTGLGLTICRRLVILMQGQMEVDSEPGTGSTFSFTVPLRPTGVSMQASLPLSWLAGKRAMVADARPATRQELCLQLERLGMKTLACASAEQAQHALAMDRPGVIVLDGDMPDIDAFSSIRLPQRPPLLLLAGGQARADSLRFDADARLLRPFTQDGLAASILQLLSGQAQEDQTPAAQPDLPLQTGAEAASLQREPVYVTAEHADGLSLLLAEDNPVNQRLAVRLLERMGHRVTVVDNGFAALEQAMRDAFDLVLMDVQMPGLDGLSVTRQLRQREMAQGASAPHIPIIAMTARAMQGDRERCLEAGMDDYISKPIDSSRLRQVLNQFDAAEAEPVLVWREALQRLDDDADLFLELAAIFLDDGPGLLESLHMALDQGDIIAAQRSVHSLKGVLVNFGALRAISQTERMSVSLHDPGQSHQWRHLADALGPLLDAVYSALRELLAAGPAAMRA